MRRTKAAEKCINTYNGQNKKGFRLYNRQPRKNLHTAISVNKTKLSVTKHDQVLIWAHIYNTSRYTANTKMYSGKHTHTHTHTQTHTHARTHARTRTRTRTHARTHSGGWLTNYNYADLKRWVFKACLKEVQSDGFLTRTRVNFRSYERQARCELRSSRGVQAASPMPGRPQVATSRDCKASCGLCFKHDKVQ